MPPMEAMRPEHIRRTKAILESIQCSKDFRCTRATFENLCKARDVGFEDCLECLEENPSACEFSALSGDPVLCKCPLRVYLTKTVGL